jgi:hypothetical protein
MARVSFVDDVPTSGGHYRPAPPRYAGGADVLMAIVARPDDANQVDDPFAVRSGGSH